MAKQQRLFEGDKADPAIAKAADLYVDLLADKKENAESLKNQQARLISLMKLANKTRIVHEGSVVEITHKDESESIKIKKAKKAR